MQIGIATPGAATPARPRALVGLQKFDRVDPAVATGEAKDALHLEPLKALTYE
ncbi:MAG: hypothetical protein JJE35_00945 [Thermoleophilia bacterium]|nr:hypothetical protein [Thermoleophilia bacterium]